MTLMSIVQLSEQAHRKISVVAGTLDTLTSIPLRPFADEIVAFLSDVSRLLLANRQAKTLPDVISFAYWCRKANIMAKKREQEQSAYFNARLGRGVSFHIAPSNIPVNFAFSYVFSLLAGNANIVRVPSKRFEQTELICSAIQESLPQHPSIAQRTALVKYSVDDALSAELSSVADARIIWGGDATVEHITSMPAPPRCKDVVFSDRYSVGLLQGDAIRAASPEDMDALATNFFNDTYLMDQNACSSPQMLFWLNADEEVKAKFWTAVRRRAQEKYELHPQVSIDKYVRLCEDIICGLASDVKPFDGMLTVVEPKELPADITHLRGVGGYFYQHDIETLAAIAPYITSQYQTLAYYGCDAYELQQFVLDSGLRGIDRIVPLGKAMDIDLIWDGYDLIAELSRIVQAH